MHEHTSNEKSNDPQARELKRRLENRHIQLIAISGAIGTGLFMGAGKVIALAGTSIILVYAIIGFFIYCVMRAMGEVLLSNLKYHSFSDMVAEYLGRQAGYVLSWTYWLGWCVAAIADMVMVAGFFQNWYPEAPAWAPALITVGILISLNLLAVKVYGEVEFWVGLIKIVAIIALLVTCFVLIASSYTSSTGTTASLSNLVQPGAMLPHGIMGFFAGFQIAIFSFNGTELIGTTAAEAKNPEETIKKAINTIPIRIMFFYILSLVGIISVISWANVSATQSPFVQLFVIAGLPAAAGIINFVVLTSAASSANSGIYSSARLLFGLSRGGQAPTALGHIAARGVPTNAILLTGVAICVGLLLLLFIPSVMTVFTLVSTIAAIVGLYTWSMILLAYIAYRKKSPMLHNRSNFKMPGGVPLAVLTLVFIVFVTGLLALEDDTRTALYFMPVWFIFLTVCYRIRNRRTAPPAHPISTVN
ncbi:amino acid permease [Pseudomonas entomophila]|uniref:amino acid permease n=1 Tax=Pseudomonas entomophila TaxID=312306 RepID=UPI0023D86221|nr:amino acid permease [Pseudomonas entomophila]MDF0731559.1 amino acid permease [Pseudomonas entomophila]